MYDYGHVASPPLSNEELVNHLHDTSGLGTHTLSRPVGHHEVGHSSHVCSLRARKERVIVNIPTQLVRYFLKLSLSLLFVVKSN